MRTRSRAEIWRADCGCEGGRWPGEGEVGELEEAHGVYEDGGGLEVTVHDAVAVKELRRRRRRLGWLLLHALSVGVLRPWVGGLQAVRRASLHDLEAWGAECEC